MTFDFRGAVRFLYLWLFRSPWTARRVAVALAFLLVVPLLEALNWLCLLADELLYRGYRRTRIETPMFIVGNPRSGTTLLHRLLAEDRARFSSMRMWQILFAPSVLQRRLAAGVAALDRRLGGPLRRRIARIEQDWHEANVMHEVSLFAPEEDDYLLLHIWSALTIGLSSGLLEEARPYTYFDLLVPETRRRQIMRFYRRCLQRHLYSEAARGSRAPTYLAKNPALAPKLDSLFAEFPDSRIIYLVRNPLEVVPSYLSMMQFSWQAVGVPLQRSGLRDFLLDMAHHWYRYPLDRLARAPDESYLIVEYEALRADPGRAVETIYEHFGLEIDAAFAHRLIEATALVRDYRSRHDYDLGSLGLSRDDIVTRFADVFERFGFDRG